MAVTVDGASGESDAHAEQHTKQKEIDDGLELPDQEEAASPATPSDVQAFKLSNAELKKRIATDLSSLGPMSVGRTSSGALVNGVRMPKGRHWKLVDPGHTWGTQETIDFLIHCVTEVNEQFPDTHKMRVGHISAKRGGALKPHRSHQSGRDVDLSYYYKRSAKFRWYRRANAKNLDRERTWAFVRALLTDTDVELIFINTSVQKLLRAHALKIGEDKAWIDSVFQYKSKHHWPIIRHAPGHDTHIHVRFFNPVAQELGRRAYKTLVARKIVKPKKYYMRYRARKGDILGRLAKRFHTTVKELQRANGLRGTRIKAGTVYLIPRKGQVKRPGVIKIPPRRLPPAKS